MLRCLPVVLCTAVTMWAKRHLLAEETQRMLQHSYEGPLLPQRRLDMGIVYCVLGETMFMDRDRAHIYSWENSFPTA